jgi:signal transduction histidine kinase/CheY-like chemotaxis protein/streptogramin lyase
VDQGRYTDTQVRLSSLNTRSLAEDEYGNIWVGHHSAGIDFISDTKQDFSLLDYQNQEGRRPSVSAMAADPDQGFWMASENELVWWQDGAIKGRWSSENVIRRKYAFPRCMMADHQGGVWIGVDDQGVYRFDKQQKRFSYIPISPEGSDIHCFAEDTEGRIWIGGEFGVYLYQNGKAELQEYVSQTIHAPATCIMPFDGAQGLLFVATLGDGIYAIDLQHHQSRHLSIAEGLPSSKINHTIGDGRGGVWLATDNGLVRVEDALGLKGISVYGKAHGLADCHIRALQQDTNGCIWMSTYSGISYFVKNTERCYNYNHYDIHLSGGFANGAVTMDNDGTIYFGSVGGVSCFNPQKMGNGSRLSEIQITACEAYNPVGSNTEIQLLTPDEEGRVTTTYRQNTIRLTFAMRNFAQNAAVDYSYMMKGMDGKWYDIGNDHDVVFRGLRPGEYTFILRAKLRSQDWEQANDTRLTIVITPPFWRTWWAYVIYAILALALIGYAIRSYKRKLTLRNALELERRESQQKQAMNEERLRFFTNITHELRTPLTLILGPIDDLMEDRDLTQQSRRRVAMIQKSAERLRNLINEILEFRKTETQNRRLTVARGDIGQFVRETCLNYKELNRNPKVQFVCRIAEDLPMIWFDSEIITTVMNNLLSNAMKYTDKGSITTTVEAVGDTLRIAVADTGYGISPEALPHVFERYYQAKGSHQASGTGIGLALVKSLAELHEGNISVESHEGQGSCFALTIGIDNTYPNALHKEDSITIEDRKVKHGAFAAKEEKLDNKEETRLQLLVVEDNADIRQYITDTFSDDFLILQAENGEEGVKMAEEHNPDIIVSDIMMPKKNGIELTRQLKGDIRTSHIPIILLTAKTTDDDKEEGYDSGADSYLTKPFTAKLLASRIRNLLTARRRLTEMIVDGNIHHPSPPDSNKGAPQLSPLDQEFIERLNRLIEDHIMQADIDMAFVTDKMAMSHSTFYRKVKALTGMTATEYIRKRRLRHCYRLLESGDYNVNQAAMMTGFNQMAHFRETFKKEFGILPSEVKKIEH